MNFDLSEDEEMLKALAERFVVDHCDLDRRRSDQKQPSGFSQANWVLLGELGLLAAPFDTGDGGMALDATALATVFEALGNGLAVEPIIENVLVAGRLFAATAPEALAAAWLPGLQSGQRRLALAHAEARARSGRLWVETRAVPGDGSIRLSGAKPFVAAGAGVDGYLVTARSAGAPHEAVGLGLYLVTSDAPGLTIEPWRWADGSMGVALRLDDVIVPASGQLAGPDPAGTGSAIDAIDAIVTMANLARCAEAVGIMGRLFADTLEYLRTRQQFGSKLAEFQAIQHRMVAQYAVIEQCRGLLNLAQVSYGTAQFPVAVAGARAFIAPASITLGHEMIQFHGGMGVTDELAIGQGHKRLLVLSRWPDDAETALDAYAGLAA